LSTFPGRITILGRRFQVGAALPCRNDLIGRVHVKRLILAFAVLAAVGGTVVAFDMTTQSAYACPKTS
jgi:hypothetical protein